MRHTGLVTSADVSHRGVVWRARELAAAATAREAALGGTGSVLAVTGAAGAGKTGLGAAIADASRREGYAVGWGATWPGDGAPALWPWRVAVAELAGPPAAELFDAPPEVGSEAWFMRAVAVVDHLRAVTAGHPSVLVLDDVHDADEHTRALAHFVALHVRSLPLVLLVTHRPDEGLEAFDREATLLALHGLDGAGAAALLAGRGVDGLGDDDLALVVDATGGLPRELHRLADAATDGPGLVAALVDDRVAALPDSLQSAAACAALLGTAPCLQDIATVTADLEVDPLALAAELDRLGLAAWQPPDVVVFRHERVRAALAATLDPCEALDVHAWAANRVDGSTDGLVRRAEHAIAAAARSEGDARVALHAASEAADALIAADDPEQAAGLLASAEAAHAAAGFGDPAAAFLAARAGAAQRAGRLAEARAQFDRAAVAADEEKDPVSLAVAALGLGGVWLAESRSAVDRERILALQHRARDGLPEGEVALRLRLDVRLAAEWAYATDELDEVEATVAAARALGDPVVLAEALSLYHHAMLGPRHGDRRLDVAREMLTVATRAGDTSLVLMALLWLTSDLFLAGSPEAERSLRELHDRAEAGGGRHTAYIARVMDSMLLQRAGRLDNAERAAEAAFALGSEVGDADAIAYYGAQLASLRWIQGRAADVLDLAAATAASSTITPPNRVFVAVFASLAAASGELDQARAALSRLRGELGSLLHSSAWLATLFSTVEAAYVVGDAEIAREAAALLEPHADLPVIGSLGVTCVGSVRRSLGLAAVTVGDVDRGIAVLEEAVAANERLGNRPLAAITQADLAVVRADRAHPGDIAAAVDLLDQAIREADAMGLAVRAAEWRDRRAAVLKRTAQDAGPPDDEVGLISRQGSAWVLSAADVEVVVPDLLGMTYLSQLLTNPGAEIAAATLAADGDDSDLSTALAVHADQPVLDDAALAAYRERITDLEDDLAEAERNADSERATHARIELDAIVDELARTTNRFGRARPFASSREHARTAVQKALRRVLDHISDAAPAFGAALRPAIQTGRTCSYTPRPGLPRRWARPVG